MARIDERASDDARRGFVLPWIAVALAAAWILAGALFKLFLGTPADLPPATQLLDDRVLNYQVAIAIELAVVALALLRPRWGFLLVLCTYLAFEAVLATQLAQGAESCGCFGSKVTIEPWQMMAIDTTLLVLMLATRPWRMRDVGAPWWLALLVAAAGAALPFALDREVTEPGPPPAVAQNGDGGGGGEAAPAKTPATRGYVDLDVESWVGDPIEETPLAKWIEGGVDALPLDGLWVIWRATCDHCARHLEELAAAPPAVPFLVLVQLKEPHDTEANGEVHVLPEGDNVMRATCPATVDYLLTTPGELWLEAGVVVRALEGAGG